MEDPYAGSKRVKQKTGMAGRRYSSTDAFRKPTLLVLSLKGLYCFKYAAGYCDTAEKDTNTKNFVVVI